MHVLLFFVSADSGNWRHSATNSIAVGTFYSYQQNSGKPFPLSVICSGRPIEMDKPHILA
jgi:hypothetical protein